MLEANNESSLLISKHDTSQSTGRPRLLPLETLLDVIAEIEDDYLCSTRLVCRDFDLEAKKRIFRAVYIGHDRDLKDNPDFTPFPCRPLKITSPDLEAKLIALQKHSAEVQALYGFLTYDLSPVHDILRNLLPSFENLRHLMLYSNSSLRYAFGRYLPVSRGCRISNLRYFATNLEPDESFKAVLDANPLITGLGLPFSTSLLHLNLQNLSVIKNRTNSLHVWFHPHPPRQTDFEIWRHSRIRNLKITWRLSVVRLAQLAPALGTLQSLRRLCILHAGELLPFLTILATVLPQLEYLSNISLDCVGPGMIAGSCTALKGFPSLKVLNANCYGSLNAAEWVDFPRIIRTKSCPNLTVFVINNDEIGGEDRDAIIFWHEENSWYSKETTYSQVAGLWDDSHPWPNLEPWNGCDVKEVSCYPDSPDD